MMLNSFDAPCLPLCKTALTIRAGQSLAAFCHPLIRQWSELYEKQHSKPQTSKMWKQCQEQCWSYLHQIGNEILSVGSVFLSWGIIDLMNMVAVLHHSNSGLGVTFLLICQGFEVSNGSQERCDWLQVEGPGSASFPWLPA